MSKTPRQHTVRFRSDEEGSLAAMMAASAGVSTSEWVATAARHQMLTWLKDGYADILGHDVAEAYRKDLQRRVNQAAKAEDTPLAKFSKQVQGADTHQPAGL